MGCLVGARLGAGPACGELAARNERRPPSQRRPVRLPSTPLFKRRGDLAHLGGEAARLLPLALPTINRNRELEPLERVKTCHRVMSPCQPRSA